MEYYIDPVVFIVGKTGGENRAVRNLLDLFAEGATIPFIARYRKEKTGNMDEVRIGEIKTLYTQFQELEKRKNAVLDTIREQEKLTPALEKQIREAKAKAKGLEPLAALLMRQENGDIVVKAARFVKGEIQDTEEALQGARDIIAEWVNESEAARNRVRCLVEREAVITAKVVKGKEQEGEKYTDYFNFQESLKRCPSHRILAIFKHRRRERLREFRADFYKRRQ